MKSAPAIAFDYRPCRGIAIAISVVTLLAMIAILASGLAAALKLSGAMAVLGYGIWAFKRHWWPVTARIARGEGGWLLVDREGVQSPVALVEHVQRGFLFVLGFRRFSGAVQRFVLTPDNCDMDLRRRLLLVVAASKDPALPITSN